MSRRSLRALLADAEPALRALPTLEPLVAALVACAERADAAPASTYLDQHAAAAELGLARTTALRLIGDYRRAGGDVQRIGRLRRVVAADFRRWLDAQRSQPAPVPEDDRGPLRVVR